MSARAEVLREGKREGNEASRVDDVDVENHLLFEVCSEVGRQGMPSSPIQPDHLAVL